MYLNKQFLNSVEAIIKDASKILCHSFTVNEKGDPTNLVTSADIAVQKFLEEKLCALIPDSCFFGEESAEKGLKGDYIWIVDPIDGTTNFTRGIGEYAISVALYNKGKIILGAVYNHKQDKMYTAMANKGAFCNNKPINVSNKQFKQSLFCTALSLYRKDFAQMCNNVISEAYMQCSDLRRFGSCALELCYLAEGMCDLYFEIRVFPWDYAAGILILQEAGGVVFSLNNQTIPFDRATPVIAANNIENFNILNNIVKKHIKNVPYNEVF